VSSWCWNVEPSDSGLPLCGRPQMCRIPGAPCFLQICKPSSYNGCAFVLCPLPPWCNSEHANISKKKLWTCSILLLSEWNGIKVGKSFPLRSPKKKKVCKLDLEKKQRGHPNPRCPLHSATHGMSFIHKVVQHCSSTKWASVKKIRTITTLCLHETLRLGDRFTILCTLDQISDA